MAHRPWVNYALLAANVLLFVLGCNGADPNIHRITPYLLHPDNPQLFQFVTCLFLHHGWLHLIGNMVFLWVFGNAVNDRLGNFGDLALYFSGGILAGVGYVLLSGNAPVLGASGAISSVTGAYLVLLPRARVTVITWLFWMIIPLEISSLYFLLFQFIFNLVSVYSELPGRGGNIAYWAHIVGYAHGILIALLLLGTRLLPRDAFDLLNLIRSRHRRGRFQRMVAQGYSPFQGVPPIPPDSRFVASRTVAAEPPPGSPLAREIMVRRQISEALGAQNLPLATDLYLQLLQIAEDTILPRQQQLDVANQLMSTERYPQAADAYERFLRHYASYEHVADIHLMLGLLYGRYLHQYDPARQNLQRAVELLRDPRKADLARRELQGLHHHGR